MSEEAKKKRRRMIAYREAIAWICENDDTEWVGKSEKEALPFAQHPSVTASFCADIYNFPIERVVIDIFKYLKSKRRRS